MSDDPMGLVNECVDPAHPSVVRNQLAQQTRKLLREQVARDLIRDALKEWDNKPGSPPAFLPHILSDVIRRRRAQQADDKTRKEAISNWEEQLKKEMGD
jgi:hypothetical protein